MNKSEKAWRDAILQLGCIVCLKEGRGATPAEQHHMLSGGRRMGHLFSIPLCYAHHRSGRDDREVTSRDHNQRRFENRYGPERDLLELVQQLVARRAADNQPGARRAA